MSEGSIQFLHCMKQREYLEKALIEGLMFTVHRVMFSPFDSSSELERECEPVFDLMRRHLMGLGVASSEMRETMRVLCHGIGNISMSIPMICFTEVQHGRRIGQHGRSYGRFGLVVKRRWLARQGADRVIYVGSSTPISKHLFHLLADKRILSIHKAPNGTFNFSNAAMIDAIRFASFIEQSKNLEEAEWRIPGQFSFFGGTSWEGVKIPLPISEIEFVFVSQDSDIDPLRSVVRFLSSKQGCTSPPPVIVFPDTIPSSPGATEGPAAP